MRVIFSNVEPIKVGFAITIEVGFGQAFWDTEQLETGRIRAGFAQGGATFWVADTLDGTLVRPGNRKFEIVLPASATALMQPKPVTFDFVRGVGVDARAIPGKFHWPVDIQVTPNA
ncbi:hypothetical protein NKL07_21795 [Mesorhizobium sp. C280B]|uniref:hypothetical protein n=1 Tax=unclassified Mesorhizobium TaxID=325217 RepID=UPI0003CEE7C0|nr:hypothetical protein [Mesorhizobium sp. LSJC280B00]ESW92919.1 hypothetical protein X772_02870 [Mesorhizobium sp. LSJC280B00]